MLKSCRVPATKGKNGTGVRVAAAAVLRSAERLLHHKGVGECSLSAVCCAALLRSVRIVHPSLACKVTLLNNHFC